MLGARRLDRINALAETIVADGGVALAVATDVTDAAQVKHLVDTAVEQYGRVDVMLNNAGLMPHSSLSGDPARRRSHHHDRRAERNGELHPVQQTFWEYDAYQCGYCPTGQMTSAVAILRDPNMAADDASVREVMSVTQCRPRAKIESSFETRRSDAPRAP